MPSAKPLSKSKLAIICSSVFILSVGACSFIPGLLPGRFALFSFLVGIILFGSFLRSKPAVIIVAVSAFAVLGAWRVSFMASDSTRQDNINRLAGEEIRLTGVIAADIRIREGFQKFSLAKLNDNQKEYWGKILVTTTLYPEYAPGDRISIACSLIAPKAYEDFDYPAYLASQGIYAICFQPEISDRIQTVAPLSVLWKIKKRFAKSINSGIKEPQASIARALVLGDSDGLSDKTRAIYSQSGLSHVIAISGLHISLLTMILMNCLLAAGVSRRTAFYLAATFIFLYVAMIGFPASGLRAALMGFLLLWSVYLGRLGSALRAVLLVCALNLLFNPLLLRHNIGFNLSYLSTIGIILITPLLTDWAKKFFLRGNKPGPLAENLLLTLAAYIPIIPVIAHHFGIISIISPLSNLFIFTVFPVILISIIFTTLISILWAKIAVWAFIIPSLMVKYLDLIASIFSYSKLFYLTIERENILIWIIYYLIITVILVKYYSNVSKKFNFKEVP